MDQLTNYKDIVRTVLGDYAALFIKNPPQGESETHTLFDEQSARYMVYTTGWWQRKERLHTVNLYVQVKNGKVWVEEDWSQDGIVDELMARGIPAHDIVLAYHPEYLRDLTDFAVG